MTKDEALKLALEALEWSKPHADAEITYNEAITAVKEALAQQNEFKPDWDEKLALTEEVIRLSKRIEELEAQPSVSVEQEPVAWRYRMPVEDGHFVWNYATYIDDPKDQRCEPLYITPPQRPSRSDIKPLTDEEIDELRSGYQSGRIGSFVSLARAIEAKLKEKNT